MAKTEFEEFIERSIEETGLYIPVKAGMVERMTVHQTECSNLHPNPDDEFCFPDIGRRRL